MDHPAPFLTGIQVPHPRARIGEGAAAPSYRADRATAIRLRNEALAAEIVCNRRDGRHYFMATGTGAQIVEHGGQSDLSPDGLLTRRHAEYTEGDCAEATIKEDPVAERIAVDKYRESVAYLGDDHPTTRRMLEEVLAAETEHADGLSRLLEHVR